MDFEKQLTKVQKFAHSAPFIKTSPFLDIFDMGPEEDFDRTLAPREFWTDTGNVELTAQQEAQAFNDFKKKGGRYSSLGPCPGSSTAAFPGAKVTPSTARVATGRKSGYVDSQKVYVTTPSTSRSQTPDSEEVPDLE